MMLRPRWIGALLLAMAVAAGFAWLGQWQLGRAIESGTEVVSPTEHMAQLSTVAKPGGPIRDAATGQLVTATGSFNPHDYRLIADRLNRGSSGYWVAGHFTLSTPDAAGNRVALAVARGWAPSRATAEAALGRLRRQPAHQATITGRLLPTEAPVFPGDGENPKTITMMSAAHLYNLWSDVRGADVYEAYVVEHQSLPGLQAIYSPPPIQQVTLNWLNVFYAVEWAVFAGFALYFWYRVVKDAKEREDEDAMELRGSPSGPASEGDGFTHSNRKVN
jgi:surfeit locus 1 family protein